MKGRGCVGWERLAECCWVPENARWWPGGLRKGVPGASSSSSPPLRKLCKMAVEATSHQPLGGRGRSGVAGVGHGGMACTNSLDLF